MKFAQLIEYNITNVFLENHTQNVMERLFPDPFRFFLQDQKAKSKIKIP